MCVLRSTVDEGVGRRRKGVVVGMVLQKLTKCE